MIAKELAGIIKALYLIDIDELEAHLKSSKEQLLHAQRFGAIIDPTGYRNALQSSELDNATAQQHIGELLLEARRTAEKLHPSVKLQIMVGGKLDSNGDWQFEEQETDAP